MGPSSMSPQSWRPCALSALAVGNASASEIPSGTYDVVSINSNSIMDRWVITLNCPELTVGCEADIQSSWVGGQAFYQGHDTWALASRVWFRSAPTKSKANGAMLFQWKTSTLEGQLTNMQRGPCQLTRLVEPADSLQTGQSFVAVHSASHTACRAAPTKLSSSLSESPSNATSSALNKAIRAARR